MASSFPVAGSSLRRFNAIVALIPLLIASSPRRHTSTRVGPSFIFPPVATAAAADARAAEPQVFSTSVGRISVLMQAGRARKGSSGGSDESGSFSRIKGARDAPNRVASVGNVAGVAGIARGVAAHDVTKVHDATDPASSLRRAAMAEGQSASTAVREIGDDHATACDVAKGRWVADPSRPLYDAKSCPFIPKKFNCRLNGRPDNTYEKWRWEVEGTACGVQHPTGVSLRKQLENKRIVYIGDSIMENMFSSMACIVYKFLGAPDVTPTREQRTYSLHWSSYNVTLSLIWSVFMVQTAWVDSSDLFKGGEIDVNKPDSSWADHIHSYDVIILNTGNWWKPRQLERYGLTLKPPFHNTDINEAYPHGLATILSALRSKQHASARSFLVSSVSFQVNASCPATRPIADVATARTVMATLIRQKNVAMRAALRALMEEEREREELDGMRAGGRREESGRGGNIEETGVGNGMRGSSLLGRVSLLDFHDLSLFRHDARPAAYHGRQSSLHDCAHYCVPGVPDAWNELLLWMLDRPNT